MLNNFGSHPNCLFKVKTLSNFNLTERAAFKSVLSDKRRTIGIQTERMKLKYGSIGHCAIETFFFFTLLHEKIIKIPLSRKFVVHRDGYK